MNKVQQSIYEKVVFPAMQNLAGIRVGEITEINYVNKRATIRYTDTQNTSEKEADNVPMIRQQGAHESGPFVGDKVVVGFFNNDYRYPVILGTIDLDYANQRGEDRDPHNRKGSNLTDLYVKREGENWNVQGTGK